MWMPSDKQREYLTLIVSMTADCLAGKGTDTANAYITNLKIICDAIPKLNGKQQKEQSA